MSDIGKERTKDNLELPKISDYEYLKELKDYEITHSFAYEFARRNPDVQNILNLLDNLFYGFEFIIYPSFFDKNCILLKNIELMDFNQKCNNFFKYLLIFFKKETDIKHFQNLQPSNIIKRISNYIEILTDKLYQEYYIIYQNDSKLLKNMYFFYDPLKYLERDKDLTYHSKVVDSNNVFQHKENNECYYFYQEIDKNDNEFSFNTFFPNFTVSLRDFTNAKIVVNLHLPKDELLAYLEIIKDDYDAEESTIKSPLELLGHELEKTKEPNSLKRISKKNKKDYVTSIIDALYVYDVYKVLEQSFADNKKKAIKIRDAKVKEIRNSINRDKMQKDEYIKELKEDSSPDIIKWSKDSLVVKVSELTKFSEDKVNIYKTLMNDYSIKLKYKELITKK